MLPAVAAKPIIFRTLFRIEPAGFGFIKTGTGSGAWVSDLVSCGRSFGQEIREVEKERVMKRLMGLFICAMVPAFMLVGVAASPAMAQDKAKSGAAKVTVLTENDKVRVFEAQFKPGDENKAVPSSFSRVVRAIKGGTLMRTYADGKTQNVEWKTGEVRFVEAEKISYTAKNVGKSDVHLYVVVLKEPKK